VPLFPSGGSIGFFCNADHISLLRSDKWVSSDILTEY
jgi:hypothetical protein